MVNSSKKVEEEIKPALRLVQGGETTESEHDLILKYRENGRKLGRSLLRQWNVHMPADEIDSLVDIGLCEAASRFNAERGASFMTFFYYHLRGYLVRAITSAASSSNFVLVYAQAAGIELGDWRPNSEEIVQWVFPELAAKHAPENVSPESILMKRQGLDRVKVAMGSLDELEQEVVTRSYIGQEALIDIAKSLGYSRCHISRVKKRALQRLRSLLEPDVEGHELDDAEDTEVFTARAQTSNRGKATKRKRGRRREVSLSTTSEKFLSKVA